MDKEKLCELITQLENGYHIEGYQLNDLKYELNHLIIKVENKYREINGMPELERYYNSFINLIKKYKEAETAFDKLQLLIDEGVYKEQDLKDECVKYNRENKDNKLKYYEWLEKYVEENEDKIEEDLEEYLQPLEINIYTDISQTNSNGFIKFDRDTYKVEILLGYGGPNIRLLVDARWNKVTYGIYWGGDKLEKDCSEYFETIEQMYCLDCY